MKRINILALAVSAVAMGFAVRAGGATGSWVLDTGGAWNNSANWTAAFPNGAGEVATINTNFASGSTITLEQGITVGTLLLADSTTAFGALTIAPGASASNTLTFDSGVSGTNAVLRKGASATANNLAEVISAPVVLNSSLSITASNGLSPGTVRIDGQISGVAGAGIVGTGTAVGGTTPLGTVILTNTSNSYTGPTVLVNGNLQFSGSVLSGSNSALGNSTAAIVVGTAASQTADASTLTLQANTSGPASSSVISRGIDFSGLNGFAGSSVNGQATSLRYIADTTISSGVRSNTLTVSGPVTLSSSRQASFITNREGMTISFTGNITGASSARSLRLGGFVSDSGSELGGLGTYHFSNVARDFVVNSLVLLSGSVVIDGSVGLNDTPSPIGRNTGNQGVGFSDGNGGNIITSAGRGVIRSVFLSTGGTSFGVLNSGQRDLQPGSGLSSNDTDYGEASGTGGVNVINGYRFGGLNTSGEVTFNSNILTLRSSVGGFTRTLSLAHNISLSANNGGISNFTGLIASIGRDGSSAQPNVTAGAPGTTSLSSNFRLTINGFRNHPDLDTNGNGIPDPGVADAVVGTPTTGVVKLSNSTILPTGTTEVLGGTLLINGTHSRAAAGTNVALGDSIIVNAGATLGGYGAIRVGKAGSTVDVSGTLNPGDSTVTRTTSASILAIDKPVVFRAGSTFEVDLNSTLASNGAGLDNRYDSIQLFGTASSITIDPTANIKVNVGFEPNINSFFLIADQQPTGAAITGTFAGTVNNTIIRASFGNVPVDLQIGYNSSAGTANDITLFSMSPVVSYAVPSGTGTWTQTGSWTNLSLTAYAPNSPNITVLLGSAAQTPSVVALDTSVTAAALRLNNTNSYTVSGAGQLTLRTTQGSGSALLDVQVGDHTIDVPVTLSGNNTAGGNSNIVVGAAASISLSQGISANIGSVTTTVNGEIYLGGTSNLGIVSGTGGVYVVGGGALTATRIRTGVLDVGSDAVVSISAAGTAAGTSVLSALAIAPGGTLNLRDNDLILAGGGVAGETALRALVAGWYQNGTFAGTSGLISSTAAAGDGLTTLAVTINDKPAGGGAIFPATFNGLVVGQSDVLVKYTYIGDTNLDGLVTTDDLANLIRGIRNGYTGWFNGDTNYDGVVNGLDYANLIAALNFNGAQLGDSGGVGGGAGGGQIPEPSALGLMLLGLPMLGRGSRRRR